MQSSRPFPFCEPKETELIYIYVCVCVVTVSIPRLLQHGALYDECSLPELQPRLHQLATSGDDVRPALECPTLGPNHSIIRFEQPSHSPSAVVSSHTHQHHQHLRADVAGYMSAPCDSRQADVQERPSAIEHPGPEEVTQDMFDSSCGQAPHLHDSVMDTVSGCFVLADGTTPTTWWNPTNTP